MDVSCKFHVCEVSRVFQRSSKDDSRKFQSCLDEVSMVFLESLRVLQKVFGVEV